MMLKHMIRMDHIEQTPQGGLIVGLAGEKIINSYRFLATFQENEEFSVRCESVELGTIVSPPPPGEKVAIAGKVWLVTDVDLKRHLVLVAPVEGTVPAYFGDCPGDIATRILERMRLVLLEDRSYPYLMANAVGRLNEARAAARAGRLGDRPLVQLGESTWALVPWLGTYSFMALERFLKIRCAGLLGLKGLDSDRPFFMQFSMRASEDYFYKVVADEAEEFDDPEELLYPKEVPIFEKYDIYLPPPLVRKGFAYAILNVEEMLNRVKQWRSFIGTSVKHLDWD
jgi:ATP-dependent Lhr-like helicase